MNVVLNEEVVYQYGDVVYSLLSKKFYFIQKTDNEEFQYRLANLSGIGGAIGDVTYDQLKKRLENKQHYTHYSLNEYSLILTKK